MESIRLVVGIAMGAFSVYAVIAYVVGSLVSIEERNRRSIERDMKTRL